MSTFRRSRRADRFGRDGNGQVFAVPVAASRNRKGGSWEDQKAHREVLSSVNDLRQPLEEGIGYSMLKKWKERRGKIAIGASIAGATLVAVTMAVPAGAVTVPSNVSYPAPTANNIIIGSGSATTYQMMMSLDDLFNQVPGCSITSTAVAGAPAASHQELDFSCETSVGGTGAPTAGSTLEQTPGYSYLDNPINDVALQEPPIGSSNGIAQLELGRNQANTGIGTAFTSPSPLQNVSAINYARSSRDPSSSKDITGLNFVAYAQDGVAPIIFTEYNGVKTSFGKLISNTPGLTTAQVQDIWNGTDYDWGQLGNKTSAPIFVYSAQEGSGTQATFKTFLGFDPSSPSNHVNCTDPVPAGTKVETVPTKANPTPTFDVPVTLAPLVPNSATCLGPDVIFENEDSSILQNGSTSTVDGVAKTWLLQNPSAGATAAVSDSIFFYSYGKYNLQCEGLKQLVSFVDKSKGSLVNIKAGTNCGTTSPVPNTKLALVPVNGVVANPTTIIGKTFPITRFLYNVYSNGTNANIPEASAPTLNYVSEVGFLCKAQTLDASANDAAANQILDPATGVWYHTEIYNTIVNNGFIPMFATDSAGNFAGLTPPAAPLAENASSSPTAYSLLAAGTAPNQYGAAYLNATVPGFTATSNPSISNAANPLGYCVVSNTDGNANS